VCLDDGIALKLFMIHVLKEGSAPPLASGQDLADASTAID
jgi:hypothetical protein